MTNVVHHPGVGAEEFRRDPTCLSAMLFDDTPFEWYRRAMEHSTEAADSYHFGAFLTLAGCVIGRRTYVLLGQRIYPNFYTLLIGPTGSPRKTTAIRSIRRIAREHFPDITFVAGGSFEGILEQLAGDRPQNLVISPNECRTLIAKGKTKATSNLIPGLTDLYDCPDDYTHKRANGNNVEVVKPFTSILTASTVDWIEAEANASDLMGGFWNRFCILDGKPKPPMHRPQPPDPQMLGKAVDALKGLNERLLWAEEGEGVEVGWSNGADAQFKERGGPQISDSLLRWLHPSEDRRTSHEEATEICTRVQGQGCPGGAGRRAYVV